MSRRQKVLGRKESGPFLALPRSLLDSPEYAALSAYAVKLLCDLGAQLRGHNNGDLCAAWSLMRARGWKSRDTLDRAKLELEEAGVIVRTRQGGKHKPTLYALTFKGIDECEGKLDAHIKASAVPFNTWKKKTLTRPPCQSDTPTVSKQEVSHAN